MSLCATRHLTWRCSGRLTGYSCAVAGERPGQTPLSCIVRYQELMLQYAVKVLITAVVVVAVSELAKRSSFWGALLASLPLTSLLAFVWLYRSTGNVQAVASLSHGIFWLVLASLPLFLILPALLKNGVGFWPAFAASCVVTVGLYFGLVWVLGRVGVRL